MTINTSAITPQVGRSGLRGSRTGFLYEEFLPELRGRVGAKQYREMADNDPVIGGMLYACQMLVRNVDWRVVPADASAAAVDAAEFVNGMLFEDMAHPFSASIEDALSMLPFGYAPMEVVYKRRQGPQKELVLTDMTIGSRPQPATPSSRFDDRKVGIDRLVLISQETVWKWFFDANGNWIGLQQITDDSPTVNIPKTKLLLFRTTSKLNDPEGRSLLRNSYVSYTRKKALEIAEGRLAMRSAGVVVLRLPADYFDPEADDQTKADFQTWQSMGTALAQDRQGVVMMPSTMQGENGTGEPAFNLEYVTADSRRSADQSAIIERLDRRIAGSILADFLLMGQTGVGSLALSSDKTGLFTNALGGILRSVRDEFNRTLIPRIWRVNGLPEATMPTLEHGDFQQRDMVELGLFLESMTKAGAQLFPDDKLEDHVRAEAQLPPRADTNPPELEDPADAKARLDGDPAPPIDETPDTSDPAEDATAAAESGTQ